MERIREEREKLVKLVERFLGRFTCGVQRPWIQVDEQTRREMCSQTNNTRTQDYIKNQIKNDGDGDRIRTAVYLVLAFCQTLR